MAKAKKKTDDKAAGKTTGSGAQAASDLASAMMLGQPAAKAWAEVMNESARFVADRLQKDVEAQQALLKCKTPAEVAQVQSEFFQTAIEEYTEEAKRMFEILSGAAEETMDEVKTGQSRDYDDVPV
jgi:hypothetical protein